jgi:hypothetical protein
LQKRYFEKMNYTSKNNLKLTDPEFSSLTIFFQLSPRAELYSHAKFSCPHNGDSVHLIRPCKSNVGMASCYNLINGKKIASSMKHYTDIYIYIRISIHYYKYMYAHHIPMSTYKKLGRLDLEIHELNQRTLSCRHECRLPLK